MRLGILVIILTLAAFPSFKCEKRPRMFSQNEINKFLEVKILYFFSFILTFYFSLFAPGARLPIPALHEQSV